jgi:hypothetical protein
VIFLGCDGYDLGRRGASSAGEVKRSRLGLVKGFLRWFSGWS